MRLLVDIPASFNAGVSFWSIPGFSLSDACGTAHYLVGVATGETESADHAEA